MGNESLIIPIGRWWRARVDFSSCFCSAFITLRLRMLRVRLSNGTDMSPTWYPRPAKLIADRYTSITLMITKNVADHYLELIRGFPDIAWPFPRTKKPLFSHSKKYFWTSTKMLSSFKVHFGWFASDFKIDVCLFLIWPVHFMGHP